jgi:hypothetical protein
MLETRASRSTKTGCRSKVFGGEMSNVCEFTSLDEANEILELLMRPFNTIGATLHQDEVYVPRLLADGHGVAHGSGLRSRFTRGMGMRQEG